VVLADRSNGIALMLQWCVCLSPVTYIAWLNSES